MLDKGRIVETGTPVELAGKDGWYAKYNQIEELGWRMQDGSGKYYYSDKNI